MITDLDSAVRGMDSKLDFQREFADIFRKYIEIVDSKISTDNGTKLQVPGPQGQIPETKSKGDVRLIENHRMKLWSDVVIVLIRLDKGYAAELLASRADDILTEFDKRFNNK